MLTADMKRIIDEMKIGYLATVNEDSTPNVSPKGTFIVLDDNRLMFGEIRSPKTIRNIATNPTVEISFVDIFSRQGVKCRGTASFIRIDDEQVDKLMPPFRIQWGDELCSLFHGIVIIDLTSASLMKSPAYDIGGKETELRQLWFSYFARLQPESVRTSVSKISDLHYEDLGV